jgi:hypothetical protein
MIASVVMCVCACVCVCFGSEPSDMIQITFENYMARIYSTIIPVIFLLYQIIARVIINFKCQLYNQSCKLRLSIVGHYVFAYDFNFGLNVLLSIMYGSPWAIHEVHDLVNNRNGST